MSDAHAADPRVTKENQLIDKMDTAKTWGEWLNDYSNLRVYQDNSGLNANPNAAHWNTKTGKEIPQQKHITFTNPYNKR
jgi:hypothetical protein